MSAPMRLETGRMNAVSSFLRWIRTNVPNPITTGSPTPIPWDFAVRRPIQVLNATKPVVGAFDMGLIQPSAVDVDDILTQVGGVDYRGRAAQTLIELAIWCDVKVLSDAEARIQRIRDTLTHALLLAGRKDSAGVDIVPPIRILDFAASATAPADTDNYIRRVRDSTWLVESDMLDPAHPEIRGWRGVTRIEWWEFMEA